MSAVRYGCTCGARFSALDWADPRSAAVSHAATCTATPYPAAFLHVHATVTVPNGPEPRIIPEAPWR